MLGKLLKHEFKGTARLFFPIFLVSIAIALLYKIFYSTADLITTEDYSVFVRVLLIFLTVVFVLILICVGASGEVVSFYRFYKNVFTDEGYLTNTLPVSPIAILSSKLIAATVWSIASVLVSIISIVIVIPWDSVYSGVKAIIAMFNNMGASIDFSAMVEGFFRALWNNIIPITVFFLMCLIGTVFNISTVYLSVSVGNLVNRHKVALSIGVFLIIVNVFGIIFSVLLTVLDNALYNVAIFAENSKGVVMTNAYVGVMLIFTALFAVLSAAELIGTHYIMKNKLNLQ